MMTVEMPLYRSTLTTLLSFATGHPHTNIDDLLAAIKRRAFEHKLTPTIGRSHGIHAEPTTFGLKLARPTPNSYAHERGC